MTVRELIDSYSKSSIVINNKDNTEYRIASYNIQFKDTNGEWINGVCYVPNYSHPCDMFVRELQSFLKEFSLKTIKK